jgi:uncharacterized protein (DUF58 family)
VIVGVLFYKAMPIRIDQNRISRFSSLELIARQVVEGFITGLHKSPFHGFSVEFAEHRLYNRGESIRNIDWKLFGRTEKLFVKRFEEETNVRCQLVIDHSPSMYFPHNSTQNPDQPSKLLFSVYAAASLFELMRRQRDAIGLSLFSDQLKLHTKNKSNPVHLKYLIGNLEQLLDNKLGSVAMQTSATNALHQIAELTHKRSLIIIFSDMMDTSEQAEGLFPALQHLRYNKHEVILFHVFDATKEAMLEYENRPYKFIDLETHDVLKLNPVQAQQVYRQSVESKNKELKIKCGQYNIDYIEADINQGFNQILLSYLIKRSKLH